MNIRYVEREDIDDKRWNGCVHYAVNGMAYGYTWYLDNVAEDWDGLVLGNYEIVFPLVKGKKYGLEYLYQPYFTQQLGIFSMKPLNKAIITEFLEAIPERFRYIDMQVNYKNYTIRDDFQFIEKVNLELDVSSPYEDLYSNYANSLKKTLKKAEKTPKHITTSISPETVVAFFKEHVGPRVPELKETHYHALHRIIYRAMSHGMGQIYGVHGPDEELVSASFQLFSKGRFINLIHATSPEGKEIAAAAYFLDYLVRANAGHQRIFDFEGSMIPSIAAFYSNFGAKEVKYWQLKRNRLPWYLRLIKK